jgi:hypothetical protein
VQAGHCGRLLRLQLRLVSMWRLDCRLCDANAVCAAWYAGNCRQEGRCGMLGVGTNSSVLIHPASASQRDVTLTETG